MRLQPTGQDGQTGASHAGLDNDEPRQRFAPYVERFVR